MVVIGGLVSGTRVEGCIYVQDEKKTQVGVSGNTLRRRDWLTLSQKGDPTPFHNRTTVLLWSFFPLVSKDFYLPNEETGMQQGLTQREQ